MLTSLVVFACFCALIALGVWQVQRLKWKTDLLRRIDALQAAPPRPIGQVELTAAAAYTRVSVDCADLEDRPALQLFSVLDGQAGYRLIAACPLGRGSILVDRGFSTGAPSGPHPPHRLSGPVVGVLRAPERPNFVTPRNEPGQDKWYWRDVPAMARALGVQGPAPVVLMLESPAPPGGSPRPVPLPRAIPNNHLGYAITWFGLAAALAGVYLAMLFGKRPGQRP